MKRAFTKLTNQIVSLILVVSMICSMGVTAFATSPKAAPVEYYSSDEVATAEAIRNQCEALSPEAKIIFLNAISGAPDLVAYYRENVDSDFEPVLRPMVAATTNDPLKQLESNLKALQLPTAVVVSLMAVGSGLLAAVADGPLPFGDAWLLVASTGAAVVLGLNWAIVSPLFPKIVDAFKECFTDSVSLIVDVFDKLKSEAKQNASAKERAEKAARDVSKKVKKKGSDDTVDLDQFKDKNGRTPNNKNSGTFVSTEDKRYTIVKDTAGHTGYDGTTKVWKLCLDGERVASLNSAGKIVGN